MHKIAAVVLLAGSLGLWPAAARAEPVRILFAGRTAGTGAFIPGAVFDDDAQTNMDVLSSTATALSGLDSAVGVATLISQIAADGHHFSGTGSALGASRSVIAAANAYGNSTYRVRFELTTPHLFDFSGSFASSGKQTLGTAPYQFGDWTAYLRPAHASTSAPPLFTYDDYGTRMLRENGWLAAGLYDFSVSALAMGNTDAGFSLGSSQYSFRFELSDAAPAPVPEPGSLLLFGMGLAGVLEKARRGRAYGFFRSSTSLLTMRTSCSAGTGSDRNASAPAAMASRRTWAPR